MAELTDEQYRQAVNLCDKVAASARCPDGGPTVAGGFLGSLRLLLNSIYENREEWVVFYGGPDPENFAGRTECTDQAEAEEMHRWIPGSGVARRTLAAGPWEVTHHPVVGPYDDLPPGVTLTIAALVHAAGGRVELTQEQLEATPRHVVSYQDPGTGTQVLCSSHDGEVPGA